MRELLKRQNTLVFLLMILCAGLASCHNKAEEDEPVSMPATVSLNGAGATFPEPIYSKWFYEYHKQHPTEVINYQSVGSGGGIGQFLQGNVDFGASDDPLSDEQISEYRNKYNATALHFPTVLGADVPSYNIPGVTEELNFTPEALAGIFLGKITKWNDVEIAKVNPTVKLPANDILIVHRSDGSGTTYVWTDYLSKVSDEWKAKVGRGTTVKWPVGMGANGNNGVSDAVKQTTDSLGYVELQFAVQKHLAYGRVRNPFGNFVKADLGSVTAAATDAANAIPDDFRVSITNVEGRNAYPVSSFTWLLIPSRIPDARKKQAVINFLHWMLTTGQDYAEPLFYSQLPREVIEKETLAISRIE